MDTNRDVVRCDIDLISPQSNTTHPMQEEKGGGSPTRGGGGGRGKGEQHKMVGKVRYSLECVILKD